MFAENRMDAKQIMASDAFKRCEAFHGHVCGGLAIGYRAATAALEWLKEKRAPDEELVAVVETDACCVDAIQVLTGCTFGKGNLIYKDYGKMGFTFFNRLTGQGVRLALKADISGANDRQMALFAKLRDGSITDAEQAELDRLGKLRTIEILDTPAADLFSITPVTETVPDKARIDASHPCACCGEPTMASKLELKGNRQVCRGCLAG
jgi:formylmethanofuran dehydrogenase subunit E